VKLNLHPGYKDYGVLGLTVDLLRAVELGVSNSASRGTSDHSSAPITIRL